MLHYEKSSYRRVSKCKYCVYQFSFFFSYNFIVQYIYVFVFADPKKIAYIQETVGETSSQSVVVAVDR